MADINCHELLHYLQPLFRHKPGYDVKEGKVPIDKNSKLLFKKSPVAQLADIMIINVTCVKSESCLGAVKGCAKVSRCRNNWPRRKVSSWRQ